MGVEFYGLIVHYENEYAILMNMGTIGEHVDKEEFEKNVYAFFNKYFAESIVIEENKVISVDIVSEYEAGKRILTLMRNGFNVVVFEPGKLIHIGGD